MEIPITTEVNALIVLISLGIAQVYLECTTEPREAYGGSAYRSLELILGLPALLNLSIFLADPDIWDIGYLSLPSHLTFVGAAIFNAAALLIVWSHLSIRRFWSAGLETRDGHRLVEKGPYRWIRHPLYSSYVLMAGGFFLMTGDWLVAAPMLAYFLAIAGRARMEEAMLAERLGEAYREYMSRTRRFLPSATMPARAGIALLRQMLSRQATTL